MPLMDQPPDLSSATHRMPALQPATLPAMRAAGDPLGANNYITTITNTASLHSLVQQGDVSVSSGATLTLGSGGLILRGSSRWLLAGSSTTSLLTSGSSSGELFVHAPNPAATDYRIWPVIADNGTTPVKLVKTFIVKNPSVIL